MPLLNEPTMLIQARRRAALYGAKAERLEAQLTEAREEQRKWLEFVNMAISLVKAERDAAPEQEGEIKAPTVVTIRGGTLAARIAEFVRERGPHKSADIAKAFSKPDETEEELARVQNTVNAAVWRRKDDLFARTPDDLVDLQTKEFQIVEPQK